MKNPFILYHTLAQRDQFSNQQISLHDKSIFFKQNEHRIANHTHSKMAKAPIARRRPADCITVRDLVHLFSKHNKTTACNCY